MPKSRLDFWEAKFRQNVRRDEDVALALKREGWRALTIWECQTEDPVTLERLVRRFLEDHQ
jgi:DNA mismatch endonuclease (patch repair protein)